MVFLIQRLEVHIIDKALPSAVQLTKDLHLVAPTEPQSEHFQRYHELIESYLPRAIPIKEAKSGGHACETLLEARPDLLHQVERLGRRVHAGLTTETLAPGFLERGDDRLHLLRAEVVESLLLLREIGEQVEQVAEHVEINETRLGVSYFSDQVAAMLLCVNGLLGGCHGA